MFVIFLTNTHKAVLYTMVCPIASTFFRFFPSGLFFRLFRLVLAVGGGIHRQVLFPQADLHKEGGGAVQAGAHRHAEEHPRQAKEAAADGRYGSDVKENAT